jgi:hypothetical protein
MIIVRPGAHAEQGELLARLIGRSEPRKPWGMEGGSCVVMRMDQGLGTKARWTERRSGLPAIAIVSALNRTARAHDKSDHLQKAAPNNMLLDNVFTARGTEMNRKIVQARCSNDSFGVQSMPELDRFAVASGSRAKSRQELKRL